jgi:hypothetical protein
LPWSTEGASDHTLRNSQVSRMAGGTLNVCTTNVHSR